MIEYDTVGPDLRRKIDDEMRRAGAQGFPFVKIGGAVVKGFDPGAYERQLGEPG